MSEVKKPDSDKAGTAGARPLGLRPKMGVETSQVR